MSVLTKLWPFRKDEVDNYPVGKQLTRSWVAATQSRLVSTWTTSPTFIDAELRSQLRTLRARSREQVRNNDYARRFVAVSQNNIIGATGVMVQAQVRRKNDPQKLDDPANLAIEAAFKDWSIRHCNFNGGLTFTDMQNALISSCIRDGEFIAIMHSGPDKGKYGFQLEIVDAELLDVNHNRQLRNGNTTRLGIEYNDEGRAVNYHFRSIDYATGQYRDAEARIVPADRVLHCFRPEEIGQNRGVPWLATSLFRMKMLSGYEEYAITAARLGASKMGFFISPDGGSYVGDDTDVEGNLITEAEPGQFEQLPSNIEFQSFDPTYPHEQFGDFMKSCLRGLSAGMGLSYHTLANDLEGVNYTSSRTGALEDREQWKALQEWVINCFIRPVYERFIDSAVLNHAILIGTVPLSGLPSEYKSARYQGRRWQWVDPSREEKANDTAINNATQSRSEIIRKSGRDPDDVFKEIAAEQAKLKSLGVVFGGIEGTIEDNKSST